MRRLTYSLLLLLAAALSVLASPDTARARFKVVTTTEDLAAIAREVAGGLADVDFLTSGYMDSHLVMAKPTYMVRIARADMLIYQGLELEIGWLPLILQGARNPKIFHGQPGLVDASLAIVPVEVPLKLDRSMGDIHPFGNPHYHLDPLNGAAVAQMIGEKLAALLPGLAPQFKARALQFKEKVEKKLEDWSARLASYKGVKVVAYHRTWSYFFKRFGIEYGGLIEIKPGIPPTARHLAALADSMKTDKIPYIVQEAYYETQSAEFLAEQTGSKALVLPASVGGAPEVKDYTGLFDYLVDKLEKERRHIDQAAGGK